MIDPDNRRCAFDCLLAWGLSIYHDSPCTKLGKRLKIGEYLHGWSPKIANRHIEGWNIESQVEDKLNTIIWVMCTYRGRIFIDISRFKCCHFCLKMCCRALRPISRPLCVDMQFWCSLRIKTIMETIYWLDFLRYSVYTGKIRHIPPACYTMGYCTEVTVERRFKVYGVKCFRKYVDAL